MSASDDALTHEHIFLGADHERNERRIWLVIALTTVMMVIEIGAGSLYGSMALAADGWHMSTHASALLISALAYLHARRQSRNRRFTFGTGKFGDLAGFASAIVLAVVALLMGWESLQRLLHPVAINFSEAIAIATVGLAVNIASAWLLRGDHGHHHAGHNHASHHHGGHQHHHGDHGRASDHGRDSDHGHDSEHRHASDHAHANEHDHAHDHHHAGSHGTAHAARDNNLRSAYVHVIADALTSVLAIVALAAGSRFGWIWLDPVMGIVGGLVIAQWAYGLARTSGGVLLDALPRGEDLPGEIRAAIETGSDRITDLHVWQVGPGHHAAIVALATPRPQAPSFYKMKLSEIHELSHVTVEVTQAEAA